MVNDRYLVYNSWFNQRIIEIEERGGENHYKELASTIMGSGRGSRREDNE